MMYRWTILVTTLVLAGCNTARQQTASGLSAEQQAYYDFAISQGLSKDKAALVAVSPVARQLYFDDQKCQSYGAKPGSDAYVSCRAQLESASKAQPQAAAQPSYGGGVDYSSAVPASDAPALQNILPPTTRCQSVSAGMGTVQTICR